MTTTKRALDSPTAIVARVQAMWEARAARPGHRRPSASFDGKRVLTLESRRSPELALLIVNYGGVPLIAPAVRETALEANDAGRCFAADVVNGRSDIVVLMTGIGTRMLVALAEPLYGRAAFVRALGATRLVARGPKPIAALREIGLAPWIAAPAPHTWREVLSVLDGNAPHVCAGGTRVAVQEYGAVNPEFLDALRARGAAVTSVPIYRWAMPHDTEPLRAAVRAIVDGSLDAVIFTASVQLAHLLQVADEMRVLADVRRGLARMFIASIGPMTSGELRRQGLPVDLEPAHAKMGYLVKEAAEHCHERLRAKRSVA